MHQIMLVYHMLHFKCDHLNVLEKLYILFTTLKRVFQEVVNSVLRFVLLADDDYFLIVKVLKHAAFKLRKRDIQKPKANTGSERHFRVLHLTCLKLFCTGGGFYLWGIYYPFRCYLVRFDYLNDINCY